MSAAEVGRLMTAERARNLTDQIKGALSVAYEALIECWQGRADQALGYDSWDAYCATEFADARMVRLAREQRQEIVGEMRRAGMSTRAISSGLGISQRTAARDLPSEPDDSDGIATVTSLDGRQRPAAQPTSNVREINANTPQSVIAERQEEAGRALPAFGIRMAIDDLLNETDDPEAVVRDCPEYARSELARVPEALAFLTALHQAMEAHR